MHAKFCLCPPRLEPVSPSPLGDSFLLGPGVHKVFVCVPQESLFLQSCGSSEIKSSWTSYSNSLGVPSPFVRSPDWEAWQEVQNVHNSARTSLVLFSSLCHPPGGYRIWFYHDWTPPVVSLLLLFCLLMWGSFLWWVPASSCRWLCKS